MVLVIELEEKVFSDQHKCNNGKTVDEVLVKRNAGFLEL
jgi:hypothetical protein